MAVQSHTRVAVALSKVSKSYGAVRALADLTFSVEEGRFFVAVRPELGRQDDGVARIAGLVPPDAGTISIGGADVTHAPIKGRGVSMVFQSFALYPHLTVRQNLAYPLVEEGVAQSRDREARARDRGDAAARRIGWSRSRRRCREASSSAWRSAAR